MEEKWQVTTVKPNPIKGYNLHHSNIFKKKLMELLSKEIPEIWLPGPEKTSPKLVKRAGIENIKSWKIIPYKGRTNLKVKKGKSFRKERR